MKFSLVALATFVGAAMANLDPIVIKVLSCACGKEVFNSESIK